ncbi:MAG: 3-phosphoshikimate 1-carboxyvinyltransferase [Planctomycetia bacterium]|nr:3-phosphoshikimate 1-carboxyvinyltransferase [Planctomycetia bacterium]
MTVETQDNDLRRVRRAGPLNAAVSIPGSKSLTNRALLLAALAPGQSHLTGVLDSEDTRIMRDALRQLGLTVNHDVVSNCVDITGTGSGFPNKRAELYIGNSGTSARFLAAVLAASGGHYRLYGKPRMHERPIGDLLATLTALGAAIEAQFGNDCPPLVIEPADALGGATTMAAHVSSQFLSAILMMAPMTNRPVSVAIDGPLVSLPYIKMTLATMKTFGVVPETDAAYRRFTFSGQEQYKPATCAIEPDASAASYFFAAAALAGGRVTIRGLSRGSLQGDVEFVDCLAAMGCEVTWENDAISVCRPVRSDGSLAPLMGIDVDMNDISDTVQTLAVVALFAESPTRIRNVAHIRHKETDRIAAVVRELRKFRVPVDEFDDGLLVRAGAHCPPQPARIATYDDHRMAMSFALAGLVLDGVLIEHPECVAKTFPNYWSVLDSLSKSTPL